MAAVIEDPLIVGMAIGRGCRPRVEPSPSAALPGARGSTAWP
jgi:hypothetical protein